MKYNRIVKHKNFKITYMKATIPYKVIVKPKSQLIKEIENLTKLKLNSSYGVSNSAYFGFSFRGGKTKKTMYA